MVEQRPHIPEAADLHEHDGLTPAHWEEVLKRTAGLKDPITKKIRAFAEKIVDGEDLDPKRFLGRRHWQSIAGLDPGKVREQRNLRLGYRTVSVKSSEHADQVREHARKAADLSFTLNDYLDSKPSLRLERGDSFEVGPFVGVDLDHKGGIIYWDKNRDRWVASLSGSWSQRYGPEYYDYAMVPLQTKPEDLIEKWLLTPQDLLSQKSMPSPSKLEEMIINQARLDPEKIKTRLKGQTSELSHLHENPTFGILEAELS